MGYFGFGKETIKLKKSTWEWIKREYKDTMKEYGKIPEYHEWLSHFPDVSNPHSLIAPSNETMCWFMRHHNRLAKEIWNHLENDCKSNEELIDVTPEMAREVGYYEDKYGNQRMELFTEVTVPHSRWTPQYYVEEMNLKFDELQEKGLTKEQAFECILTFEEYLDKHDVRIELPKGDDTLYAGDDCVFCEKEGEYRHQNDSDLQYDCWHCKEKECQNYEEFDEEEENK